MADSETALLEQYVRTRDAFAFRELVEQHQDMVFAACHRVLGNRADAEDASQNCFLKFAQAAGRLKSPIAGWLHTVAVQGSIDILRSGIARRARERAVAVHPDQPAASESAWADVLGEVDAAIVALPERLRTPIVLYFLERRTQAEVAVEMGLARRSVGKRLHRGVEALQRRLMRAGIVAPAVALTAMLTANAAEAAPAALAATLGKVALAAASGTKAAATGGTLLTLKTAAVLIVGAAVGAGALAIQQAAKPPHPAPLAATPAPPPVQANTRMAFLKLTLPAHRIGLGELAKLIKEQTRIDVAYNLPIGWPQVSILKPGKQNLGDVLTAINASGAGTTEIGVDRDRMVICIWRVPDAQMLAEMMKLAASDDVLERCTGARWLETVGGRDALVQLLKMLGDENARVRYYAAKSIVEGWPAGAGAAVVPCVAPKGTGLVVAKAIETATWSETRHNMLTIARKLRDPKMLPVLKEQLLRDGRRTVKNGMYSIRLICETVVHIGGPEAEALLLAVVDELPRIPAQWAYFYLGKLGTDKAVARLIKQVDFEKQKKDEARLYRLIQALGASDNPAAMRQLIQMRNWPIIGKNGAGEVVRYMTGSSTPEAQALCLEMFRATTDPAEQYALTGVPAVRDLLFAKLAKDGDIEPTSALALAGTPDPRRVRLVPTLANILGDKAQEAHVKSMAVRALGSIAGPEAEKVLIALAEADGNAGGLCGMALDALGFRPTAEARTALRAALEDPFTRIRAAQALSQMPDPDDLDVLLAAARKMPSMREQMAPAWHPFFKFESAWDAVASIGGERAARELVAQAKQNPVAIRAFVFSFDPHVVNVIRAACANDNLERHGQLTAELYSRISPTSLLDMRTAMRQGIDVPPPYAYYAVSVALAELPTATEEFKVKRAELLGWTRDPRAIDAMAKLLADAKQPVAVRRACAEGILFHHNGVTCRTAPTVVDIMRRALKDDKDEDIRKLAAMALKGWGVTTVKRRKPPKVRPGEREFQPPPDP